MRIVIAEDQVLLRDGLVRLLEGAGHSVVAQVGYLVLASPVAGILLGRGPEGPTADEVKAFGQHAAAFSLAALGDLPNAAVTRDTSLASAHQ